ncbi:MAG: chemotaxis protein CheW [Pseudomonadales bacterium]|nr:chemotaxis protein CheW [Halioglobus sp.]MCP5129725.1 chemotaxis protein CheW [Pseudomonadales bacterium]
MSSHARHAVAMLEQAYADNGVASPALASAPMMWIGTSLGIAGVPLLVGAGEIDEIVETPAVTPIPGTKPWVMGVAAYMGGLLPIISGDVFFRHRPYAGRVRDFCMVIRRPGFYFGVTLSAVEQDMKFPLEERDLRHPVDEDFTEFTLGGFSDGDRFLAVLDIERLVADSELSNAAALGAVSNEEKGDE